MALKDGIELVIENMQEEIEDLKGVEDAGSAYTRNALKGYVKQLKALVKACGDTSTPTPQFAMPHLMSPAIQTAAEVEKYRPEFIKKRQEKIKMEDDFLGGDMIELVDFPGYDPKIPEYISTPSGGQVGQKILLPQGAFRLRRRDKKLVLVYDEYETEQAKQQLKGQPSKSEGGVILGSE